MLVHLRLPAVNETGRVAPGPLLGEVSKTRQGLFDLLYLTLSGGELRTHDCIYLSVSAEWPPIPHEPFRGLIFAQYQIVAVNGCVFQQRLLSANAMPASYGNGTNRLSNQALKANSTVAVPRCVRSEL